MNRENTLNQILHGAKYPGQFRSSEALGFYNYKFTLVDDSYAVLPVTSENRDIAAKSGSKGTYFGIYLMATRIFYAGKFVTYDYEYLPNFDLMRVASDDNLKFYMYYR